MMFVILATAAVVLASLPALLHRAGRRLRPAEWTMLCVVALAGAVVLVESALLLLAAPIMLSIAGFDSLAAACEDMIGPLAATSPWVGPIAVVAAFGLPLAAAAQWRRIAVRSAELWIEPGLGRHEPCADFELVVLPTDKALAYCVARPSKQVVVSEGLAQRLPADQLAAVLAHEQAHLACRHAGMLRLAATAAKVLTWWPPAHGSGRVVRSAVERWADDVAINGDQHRRRVLRSALLGLVAVEPPSGVAAFSPVEGTADRLIALDDEGSKRATPMVRLGMYAPGALVATTVTATLYSCAAIVTSSVTTIYQCCSM